MSEGSLARPRKRARVPLACTTCRERKTRCDGRQPICVACEKRHVAYSCTYERAPRRTSPHAERSRERELSTPPHDLGLPLPSESHVRGAPRQVPESTTTASSWTPHGDDTVDGLATIPSYTNADDLYGPSSSVAFTRSLLPSIASRDAENEHSPRSRRPRFPRRPRSPDRLLDHHEASAILPRRRSADDFLRCYWDFIQPVFPILHKPTFTKQYERLWRSSDEDTIEDDTLRETEDVIFVSILNLVFALGCQFSHIVMLAQRGEVADSFYQRSRRIYPFDILDSLSLSVVQMLLLNGVYLQSSHYAGRCWNTVGLAIRVAQSLGLHFESTVSERSTQLRREMGRRIWHNCVSLDRLLAMTFGRPTMTTGSTSVALPAAIDDEYLNTSENRTQRPGVLSEMSLFVFSCKLFDILDDVLQLFYTRGASLSSQKDSTSQSQLKGVLTQTLEISRRLEHFSDTIPSELQVKDRPPMPAADRYQGLNLQKQVLYCRFLYVRMLSLRPLLVHTIRLESISHGNVVPGLKPSSLDYEIIRRSCQQCVETAHQLIEAIHDNLGTPYRSTGWHAVYFTFSAATIVLASSQSSMTKTSLQDEAFELFWRRCLFILRDQELQLVTAGRAINILEAKKQYMMSVRSQAVRENFRGEDSNSSIRAGYEKAAESSSTATQVLSNSGQAHHDDDDADEQLPFVFDVDCLSETWLDDCLADLDWLVPSTAQL